MLTVSVPGEEARGYLGELPAEVRLLDWDGTGPRPDGAEAMPDVIVHQLTAIGPLDLRHFDRDFALTNRLRTDGTDYLLSAGQAAGVQRFVAQSYFAVYERAGGPVKSEDDQLDSAPAKGMRETLAKAGLRYVD